MRRSDRISAVTTNTVIVEVDEAMVRGYGCDQIRDKGDQTHRVTKAVQNEVL
jgi:hypothetical protein